MSQSKQNPMFRGAPSNAPFRSFTAGSMDTIGLTFEKSNVLSHHFMNTIPDVTKKLEAVDIRAPELPTRSFPVLVFRGGDDIPTFKTYLEMCIAMMSGAGQDQGWILGGILSMFNLISELTPLDTFRKIVKDYGWTYKTVMVHDAKALMTLMVPLDSTMANRVLEASELETWPEPIGTPFLIPFSSTTYNLPLVANLEINMYDIYIGVCLTCFVKQLNDNNIVNWLQNRIKAFTAKVGLAVGQNDVFDPSSFPPITTLRGVQALFSAYHEIRAAVMIRILRVAHEATSFGGICKVIAQYAKGTDMTHFMLINTYLMQMYPHVLGLPILKPYIDVLVETFKNFDECGLTAEYWPYARLMLDERKSLFLQRQKFTILTKIAVRLGQQIIPSLEHYAAAEEGTHLTNQIVDYVINYIDSTRDLAKDGDIQARDIVGKTTLVQAEILNNFSNMVTGEEAVKEETGVDVAAIARSRTHATA